MKGSQIFEGKNLRAEDIKGKEPIVAIDKVTTQQFDDGLKPIIWFIGAKKSLVCNRTNWNAIVEVTGEDDSDKWHGKKVKLVVTKVDYQGRRVDAIRVEDPRARKTYVEDDLPPSREPGDDDIPF